MSLSFLFTSLIVVIAPSTGVLYTLATGLARGHRASVFAAIGCTLGIIPHLAAAVLGLTTILHASALIFDALKYLGVVYLLYMAVMTLRDNGPLRVEPAATPQRPLKIVATGIFLNILNPKLSIFFFAFLPQFIEVGDPLALTHMLELSATFMAMTLIVFVVYGAFAAAIRRHVIARPRILHWMRRGFAGAFAFLGVKLALAER